MLDNMRRQGASVFIYLIFGILIAVFVINFRPGGNKGDGGTGCTGSTNTVVTVEGATATQTAYHVAYSSPTNQGQGRQRVYVALETLIRRELLANAAREHGIEVDGDMVDEAIKRGFFFLGGQRIDLGEHIFDEPEDATGKKDGTRFWNLKKYKSWVNQLNVSLGSYRDEQTTSMQAAMMADLLKSDVRVSREEARENYLYDNTTATYDVVTFAPNAYRTAMKLTEADTERYLTSHEDAVKAKFKADERTYKGRKPQLRLHQIFIAKAEPPKAEPPKPDDKKVDDKKVDDKKAGDKDAKADAKKDDKTAKADGKKDDKKDDKKVEPKKEAIKAVGMPIEEAKTKLEAARTAIAAKKLTFADAVKELATSDTDKANHGDLGWHTIESPALSEKAVNDAVKTLKPGDLSPVIVADRGVYLLMADDKREGDFSYDQVKQEIAATLAKDEWSKEAAKRAALTALATAHAGKGKNLDEMFEKAPEAPHGAPGMPDFKSMTPEQQKRMIEQLQRQMQGGQHGALEVESKDQPAGWFADKDDKGSAVPAESAGSASPTATAGSAAPTAGSAAPTAGSAAPTAGSAATPAAGAGSAAPAPAAPAAELVASADTLPAFGDVAPPKVSHHGPGPRSTHMDGIGVSKDASTALFDELAPGNLAKRIYETDTGFVLIQLTGKGDPNSDEFDKKADEEISQLRNSRAAAMIDEWLKTRCEAAAKAGKIKPLQEMLRETDDKGQPLPEVYKPCMYMR